MSGRCLSAFASMGWRDESPFPLAQEAPKVHKEPSPQNFLPFTKHVYTQVECLFLKCSEPTEKRFSGQRDLPPLHKLIPGTHIKMEKRPNSSELSFHTQTHTYMHTHRHAHTHTHVCTHTMHICAHTPCTHMSCTCTCKHTLCTQEQYNNFYLHIILRARTASGSQNNPVQ